MFALHITQDSSKDAKTWKFRINKKNEDPLSSCKAKTLSNEWENFLYQQHNEFPFPFHIFLRLKCAASRYVYTTIKSSGETRCTGGHSNSNKISFIASINHRRLIYVTTHWSLQFCFPAFRPPHGNRQRVKGQSKWCYILFNITWKC